jgi:hypothetical protein
MKKFAAAVAVLALSAGPLMAGVAPCGPGTSVACPSPVPEPATMALLAGGAVLLGATAWRRRKNR